MRKVIAFLIAGAASLGLPAAAFGNHRRSVQTGNGVCVVLAQNGGERLVTPEIEPAVRARLEERFAEPTTTANPHPLHVHVHRGAAGDPLDIGVYGTATDPCIASGDYVNVTP